MFFTENEQEFSLDLQAFKLGLISIPVSEDEFFQINSRLGYKFIRPNHILFHRYVNLPSDFFYPEQALF